MATLACQILGEARGLADDQQPLRVEELYANYFDLVWRNLRRLGVADASLDDAVQDVFVVVVRRADEFLQQSTTKTWIIGIVLRVARDHRRAQRRHSARVAKFAEHSAVSLAPACPTEELELREAAILVRELLQEFPEELRNVFVLVELEGMTLRDVAIATGLSLATTQRRLSTARQAFDKALSARAQLDGKGPLR